jgi:predicted nuclease with TOPRIM domain
MNDIEIYGMKVNDIRDVREVLTVLWAIQEKQDELVRLQGEVAGELKEKVNDFTTLLSKLNETISLIDEINDNLNKFRDGLITVNDNIVNTYKEVTKTYSEVYEIKAKLDDIRDTVAKATEKKVSTALASIVNESKNQLSEQAYKVNAQFEQEIDKLNKKVNQIATTTKKVSRVLNIKIFIVSAILGLLLGFAVSHIDTSFIENLTTTTQTNK